MRAAGWSMMTVLFTASALFAQQPPAAPPLNPGIPDALRGLLQQWEQQMKAIKTIQATVVRTQTDKSETPPAVFAGTPKLLRPDRAELYLVKQTTPPQPNPPQQYE